MHSGTRTDLPSANRPDVSQADAAALLNVSTRAIQHAKHVAREAPELIERVSTERPVSYHLVDRVLKSTNLPDPMWKLVLALYAMHQLDEQSTAWPAIGTIATLACRDDKQIRRVVQELVDFRLLTREYESKGGRRSADQRPVGRTNEYRINLQALNNPPTRDQVTRARAGKRNPPAGDPLTLPPVTVNPPAGDPLTLPPAGGEYVVESVIEEVRESVRRTRKRARADSPNPALSAGKGGLPANFTTSARVRKWAAEHGYQSLPQHLEAFRNKALARGYRYVDWDAAFMEAIRSDWAKLNGGRTRTKHEARATVAAAILGEKHDDAHEYDERDITGDSQRIA